MKGTERKSKNKMRNRQGKEMISWFKEDRWGIMNGAKTGDEVKEGKR